MQKTINRTLLLVITCLIILLVYRVISKPSAEELKAQVAIAAIESPHINIKEAITPDKEAVEIIIKDYLMNNPEVIIAAIENMQKQKIAQMAEKANNYLEEKTTEIQDTHTSPFLGNINSNSIIVVFYDYNCSFCKKGDRSINQLLEKNNDVKVILRPFPILGENSVYLAKLALAIYKIMPEKFAAVHQELMLTTNPSKEIITQILKDHGLDVGIIEQTIASPEVQNTINENFELANNLSIKGAPAFIINGKLIPGLINLEEFEKILSNKQ